MSNTNNNLNNFKSQNFNWSLIQNEMINKLGKSVPDNFSKDLLGQFLPGGHYRNQTLVDKNGSLYCLGIFGQCIYVNPKYETVIVKLSSQPGPAIPKLLIDSMIAMNKIAVSV